MILYKKLHLIPRGQAKGLTWFTPSDDQSLISRSQILARIMGALGGRAAEEVVFGYPEVTTGAGNDLTASDVNGETNGYKIWYVKYWSFSVRKSRF